MTWALYSTWEDLTAIEAGFQETGLSGPLRNKLRGYLDGGLRDWRLSPCIPPEHPCFATDGVSSGPMGHCMVVVVCTFGTLADFRSLLQQLIGKNPGAAYYTFVQDFIMNGWMAVDPYPPPAGYWDGRTCT